METPFNFQEVAGIGFNGDPEPTAGGGHDEQGPPHFPTPDSPPLPPTTGGGAYMPEGADPLPPA